ncbi:MAG: flagellin FliC [Bdellovibrionaceae bacterium]|nr:flagellin FliC [Pseudobdellovibrionaceae bacterium]|tara:strand:+ start:4626 stop:5459 length:834 start_codon:yes stop_codon:yes gene_type:complete
MGMRVNTNVQSIAAQRTLEKNNISQQKSIEKLAAGTRIVRAADDAAGLAISERMRANIGSIRQNARNAQDGISMIQVAEGSFNEINNVLVRFRELAVQSASDTIGDKERSYIDKEVQQLKQEVDRIANGTEFNGKNLLNGSGEVLQIQVGPMNDPELDRFYLDTSKTNSTTDALGLADFNTLSREASQESLAAIDNAIDMVVENRSDLGAQQNRLESTIRNLKIYDENLSAARSRIYDVDIASETAELTRSNILTSAGVSVLSQANQNSMRALQLLG